MVLQLLLQSLILFIDIYYQVTAIGQLTIKKTNASSYHFEQNFDFI